MTEDTIQIMDEIRSAEEGNIKIQYYTLEGKEPVIHMCPGDLTILCNVLYDYTNLLDMFAKEQDTYGRFQYEYHAKRCRKIRQILESSLGYSVEKAIEQCKKKRARNMEDDVGEDALVQMVRRRRPEKKPEEKEVKK